MLEPYILQLQIFYVHVDPQKLKVEIIEGGVEIPVIELAKQILMNQHQEHKDR